MSNSRNKRKKKQVEEISAEEAVEVAEKLAEVMEEIPKEILDANEEKGEIEELPLSLEGLDKARADKQLVEDAEEVVANILEKETPVEEKASLLQSLTDAFSARIKTTVAKVTDYINPIEVENTSGLTIIEKDAQGDPRWMGWVSNNFKDREGDIITEAAHKEFIEFLDSNPDIAPQFRSWHVKGTERKSRADWWSSNNGFLLMSGKLTQKEAEGLQRAAKKNKLGMSHGFIIPPGGAKPLEKGRLEISEYRTFEVSDLPLRFAANPWTNIEAISKEAEMSNTDKVRHLIEIVGDEDHVKRLLGQTEDAKETLTTAGVESKEAAPDATTEVKQEETTSGSDAQKEDTAGFDKLVKAIGDIYQLDELEKWVEQVNQDLALLPKILDAVTQTSKSQDELVAEQFTPPVQKQRAWSRPSQSATNVADEEVDKDLLASTPSSNGSGGDNWVNSMLPGGN